MKINKIKEKLTEGLSLFENDTLTNVFTKNIREAVLHRDEDNIEDPKNSEDELDDELAVKPIDVDDIERPEDVSPRERMAQPITDPEVFNSGDPQIQPTNLVTGGEELTGRDKGLELSASDNDIKRIIDSNMMVKIKYKSNSGDGGSKIYNVAIYALGTNLRDNRAIRVYNSFGGNGSGWKTFLIGNIEGITVSGQHMGKAAISDYLTNTPKDGGSPEIQGYKQHLDKSFKTIDHQKAVNNEFSKPKIKN